MREGDSFSHRAAKMKHFLWLLLSQVESINVK